MINVVYIFYVHNVVGNDINSINVIYGGTLPAFKYEIKDFFFTRLGTGSSIVTPFVVTYASRSTRTHTYTKKYLGNTLFPRYYITPHSSLKWMNNDALEEATNRGVLVNTSQVGNF